MSEVLYNNESSEQLLIQREFIIGYHSKLSFAVDQINTLLIEKGIDNYLVHGVKSPSIQIITDILENGVKQIRRSKEETVHTTFSVGRVYGINLNKSLHPSILFDEYFISFTETQKDSVGGIILLSPLPEGLEEIIDPSPLYDLSHPEDQDINYGPKPHKAIIVNLTKDSSLPEDLFKLTIHLVNTQNNSQLKEILSSDGFLQKYMPQIS